MRTSRVGGQLLADGGGLAGDDVEHALGDAGPLGQHRQRQRGQRRLGGGLAAPPCSRRPAPGATLRVIMAAGKFHGVMAPTTPTGCLMTTMRRIWLEGRDGLAVDALGLLGEELDEAGGVERSRPWPRPAACPARWSSAAPARRGGRYQVEPAAHDRGRAPWPASRPGGESAWRRLDGFARLGLAEIGHAGDDRPSRGCSPQGGRAHPRAADQALLFD